MATKDNDTILNELYGLLSNGGFDNLAQVLQTLFNQAMLIERQNHLGIDQPYQRGCHRQGQANGFKDKTVMTRVGALDLKVPQTRDSDFYPTSLEKGIRSERALRMALAEMYIQGVSTRKVAEITEHLIGLNITSDQVSRATQALDESLEAWRQQKITASYEYVYLDALYEHVREGQHVVSQAIMIALGVRSDGHRDVLGVHIGLSESEVNWRNFFRSLQERGLSGVKLFISDDHSGLKSARMAEFPTVPWQRCFFHLQQNAQSYVPSQALKKIVAREIRDIICSPELSDAQERLQKFVRKYETKAPKLAQWAEENLPESFTFFQFPTEHWDKIRTSNLVERVNKEIRRRTRVIGVFPNSASYLRLASSLLIDLSEKWLKERRYMPRAE